MNNTIIIHANPAKGNAQKVEQNAKCYAHWQEVINLLLDKGFKVIQIAASNEKIYSDVYTKMNLPFPEISKLCEKADAIIAVDSFMPHLVNLYKVKIPIIVLWTENDPNIFGYEGHIHLFKDRKYFRPQQYCWRPWGDTVINQEESIEPEIVVDTVLKITENK